MPKMKLKFENLPTNVITDIKLQLLKEQGFLCCYTLNEISLDTCKIVHFHPRKYFPEQSLDYANMFLAYDYPDKVPITQQVGEQTKANTLMPNYLIDPRCSDYFRYNTLGEIVPNGDNNYRTVRKCRDNFRKLEPEQQLVFSTIELLNLNANWLKEQRKAIHLQILKNFRRASRGQIDKTIELFSKKDKTGRYKRYCEVVIYYLKEL